MAIETGTIIAGVGVALAFVLALLVVRRVAAWFKASARGLGILALAVVVVGLIGLALYSNAAQAKATARTATVATGGMATGGLVLVGGFLLVLGGLALAGLYLWWRIEQTRRGTGSAYRVLPGPEQLPQGHQVDQVTAVPPVAYVVEGGQDVEPFPVEWPTFEEQQQQVGTLPDWR